VLEFDVLLAKTSELFEGIGIVAALGNRIPKIHDSNIGPTAKYSYFY